MQIHTKGGLLLLCCLALGGAANGAKQGEVAQPRTTILSRLADFAPPAPPEGWYLECGEKWDCLRAMDREHPAEDRVFPVDVCLMIHMEVNPDVLPRRIVKSDVAEILSLYAERPWTKLPGYRPWTHSSFIRSLSAAERNTLADELVVFIRRELAAKDCR